MEIKQGCEPFAGFRCSATSLNLMPKSSNGIKRSAAGAIKNRIPFSGNQLTLK